MSWRRRGLEGILASVDKQTKSLCQELNSKIKKDLHKEINTYPSHMTLH
jgi:hypothetical protein